MFFSTREQTKFAPADRNYPLATYTTARRCFSSCYTGQLTVRWIDDEQHGLLILRRVIVKHQRAQAELRFIRIAILQMKPWLYARLRNLDQTAVNETMRKISTALTAVRATSCRLKLIPGDLLLWRLRATLRLEETALEIAYTKTMCYIPSSRSRPFVERVFTVGTNTYIPIPDYP